MLQAAPRQADQGGAQVPRLQRVSRARAIAWAGTERARHRNHQPPLVEVVNHLTGCMEEFAFCSRHQPQQSFLKDCVTAREMRAWRPPSHRH